MNQDWINKINQSDISELEGWERRITITRSMNGYGEIIKHLTIIKNVRFYLSEYIVKDSYGEKIICKKYKFQAHKGIIDKKNDAIFRCKIPNDVEKSFNSIIKFAKSKGFIERNLL